MLCGGSDHRKVVEVYLKVFLQNRANPKLGDREMAVIQRFVFRLLRETGGQDLVEYSLVVALLAFGCVAGMQSLSSGISDSFKTMSSDLSTSL